MLVVEAFGFALFRDWDRWICGVNVFCGVRATSSINLGTKIVWLLVQLVLCGACAALAFFSPSFDFCRAHMYYASL